MSDVEKKRAYVASLYDGPRWKARVRKMPEAQVIAIYLRETNNPKKDASQRSDKKQKESGSDDLPF